MTIENKANTLDLDSLTKEQKQQYFAELANSLSPAEQKEAKAKNRNKLNDKELALLRQLEDLVNQINELTAPHLNSNHRPLKTNINTILDSISRATLVYSSDKKKALIQEIFTDTKELSNTDLKFKLSEVTGVDIVDNFFSKEILELGYISEKRSIGESKTKTKYWIKPTSN